MSLAQEEKRKLQNKKEDIQTNPEIPPEDAEWATTEYESRIEDEGAEKPGTKALYMRDIERILEKLPCSIHQLPDKTEEELLEINEKVKDNIQNSVYKRNDGELGKRQKNGQWAAWKRALKELGLNPAEHEDYMPSPVNFTSKEKDVNTRADTKDTDLPNSQQMKKFLQTLGNVSQDGTSLRNQALILTIWDRGMRKGEILPVQMKQVRVQGKRVFLQIEGNKKADDRRVEIMQGRKTLKDWIQQHPYRDDPEAYLFYNVRQDEPYQELSSHPLARKIHEARKKSGQNFKTSGEPFHIFRKAMTTYYKINEILDWEDICEIQGKKPDATKPDYLLMAMDDIQNKAAEGLGLDDQDDREKENRMRGPPLKPVECRCGELNKCFRETCESCGTELPDAEMPKGEVFQEEAEDKNQEIGKIQGLIKALNASGVDIDKGDVEKYL